MKILIIEDEKPAARQLQKLIVQARPKVEILAVLDSVELAVDWLKNKNAPDLVFLDIQLADGLSFSIFEQVEVNVPIIFTTAFDQYALQAFQVNSVDYLLKPIEPNDLQKAIEKYENTQQKNVQIIDSQLLINLTQSLQQPSYKSRFLVKSGQQLTYLSTENIRYFYSEDGMTFARDEEGKRHILDYTLDQIEGKMNPMHFFRISRKFLIHLESIAQINTWFNSRLKLDLQPEMKGDVIVSRERVATFKQWLDQ